MKDALNCLIPAVQEDMMNGITGVRCITGSLSSNGYYGYQPPMVQPPQTTEQQQQYNNTNYPQQQTIARMETEEMDIQFNNYIEPESQCEQDSRNPPVHLNNNTAKNKRPWDSLDELPINKKRRGNDFESLPLIHDPPANTNHRVNNMRQPTHNMPDMSRCLMGHYV